MEIHAINVWLEIAIKVLTGGGIIGGVFASYMRFFKGRVWKMRLKPTVDVKLIEKGGEIYIHIVSEITNCGTVKTELEREYTVLEIYVSEDFTPEFIPVLSKWQYRGIAKAFVEHSTIEAGESINDHHLFLIPKEDKQFYKIDLSVMSGRTSWHCTSIVENEYSSHTS